MVMDYASAGVDRDARRKAKDFSLFDSEGFVRTPFNVLTKAGEGRLRVLCADGVGTKVLLAQLADKHDSIGIDGVAMVANDVVRCGAKPLELVDVIDVHHSEETLLQEILKGIKEGAEEAGCQVVGGETADVASLLQGVSDNPYQLNFFCLGEVGEEKLVDGSKVEEGDVVVGMPSSGLHSNGVSLARKALFKEWGGRFEALDQPDGFDKPLVLEALTPTRVYVKPVLKAMKDFGVKAAVHVTGDAFAKFKALGKGFRFDNFKPPEIFGLVQEAGGVSDEEMFKTFNMGWGFALVVSPDDVDGVVQALGEGEEIGVVAGKGVTVEFKEKKLLL